MYPLFDELILNILLYGASVSVGIVGLFLAMDDYRQGVLVVAGVIAISLGLIGSMSYPLFYQGIASILIYEILVILGIIGFLLLINSRGLEEDTEDQDELGH